MWRHTTGLLLATVFFLLAALQLLLPNFKGEVLQRIRGLRTSHRFPGSVAGRGLAGTASNLSSFCVRPIAAPQSESRAAPLLFVLGNTKCGTTTLHAEISKRFSSFSPGSALELARSCRGRQYCVKEKTYFGARYVSQASAAQYLKSFSECGKAGQPEVFSGDFTPTMFKRAVPAFQQIKDFMLHHVTPSTSPRTLKYVVSFREPIQRTASCFGHAMRKGIQAWLGHGRHEQFQTWVVRKVWEARRCLGSGGGHLHELPRRCEDNCLTQSLHVLHMRAWLHQVPPSQFLVTDVEEIKLANNTYWERLGEFIGITPEPHKLDSAKTEVSHHNANPHEYNKLSDKVKALVSDFFAPWELALRTELCQRHAQGLVLLSRRISSSCGQ